MDERILENERLQMEQIRELDLEELQVEEVDDTHNSSDDDSDPSRHGDGGIGSHGGLTFDACLASLHTYLGEVEDTHRRLAFLDGGAILNLPMFYLEGAVLFPEATLPLRVIQPRFIAAVERALNQADAPYTIGVVRVHRGPDDQRLHFATIGTTAEIRQYRRLEDGSLNVVTRGQQRFYLQRRWIDVEGALCAEVQIIQEDLPLRTPRNAFGELASVSNLWSRSLSCSRNSRAKWHKSQCEENDSESMSETSFESDLSPTEMRMHKSAIDSTNSFDRIDEMMSSDDEGFELVSGSQLGRYHSNEFRGSSQHCIIDRGSESEDTSPGIGNQFTPGKISHQSCKGERWKKKGLLSDSNWAYRVPKSYWPNWVYQMYDSYYLARRAADMWRQIIGVPSMDDLVKKPDLLSFFIASKIPISDSTRQELLEIHGISYRLRREIELLECFDRVRCKNCQVAYVLSFLFFFLLLLLCSLTTITT
uniref:Lon N-terminal domain-containing protein n=1 Tax=Nelumbo nucifera TaxID=4432 RepID=A0A822ZVF9_NELNU|nr:TPA_asm: hypothetical protein HUJ06_018804 [Nelumbo nucifera]